MTAFDNGFAQVVDVEKGFSNDERDPGNWTGGKVGEGTLKGTMYGISAAAYPTLDIASITPTKSKAIYLRDYWEKCRCDTLPDAVAIALFIEAVNMGVSGATKALQRSLGAEPDGDIGQITIGLAHSHGVDEVLENFLTECASMYIKMENFDTYGKGWMRRLLKIAIKAKT